MNKNLDILDNLGSFISGTQSNNFFSDKIDQSQDLNLNNPIFVYYININGLTRQRSEEMLSSIAANFRYNNVTVWVVPTSSPTKIECIYNGYKVDGIKQE